MSSATPSHRNWRKAERSLSETPCFGPSWGTGFFNGPDGAGPSRRDDRRVVRGIRLSESPLSRSGSRNGFRSAMMPPHLSASKFFQNSATRPPKNDFAAYDFRAMPAHHLPRVTTLGLARPRFWRAAQTSAIWVFKTPEKMNQPLGRSFLSRPGAEAMRSSL